MRASDRYITPGVVIVAVLTAGLVILGITLAVAYLAARGVDPAPIMQLVPALVAAITGIGTVVLQLVNRRTVTRTERNTGPLAPEGVPVDLRAELADVRGGQQQIAEALWGFADALPQAAPRYDDLDEPEPNPPTVERAATRARERQC